MKKYKDENSLENLGIDELDIIISTIENEMQSKTGYKGFFASILSILVALVIVVFTSDINIIIKGVGVMIYIFIVALYFFVSAKELNKLHEYLRILKFVKANK